MIGAQMTRGDPNLSNTSHHHGALLEALRHTTINLAFHIQNDVTLTSLVYSVTELSFPRCVAVYIFRWRWCGLDSGNMTKVFKITIGPFIPCMQVFRCILSNTLTVFGVVM